MRKNINEILLNNINEGNGMFDQSNSAEELTQLMCYREVKSIVDFIGLEYFVPDYQEEVIKQLGASYPKETILNAIEQFKKELA